jgi:hypothetical protein
MYLNNQLNQLNKQSMKIKLLSSYRNGNGNVVFVYKVTGSKNQIATYVEAQSEYLKYEDGDETKSPLFFTTNFAGNDGELVITQAGKIVVDTTEQNKLASIMKQHAGTPLGDALAKAAADKMMKELSKATPASASAQATPTPTAENAEKDLDAL